MAPASTNAADTFEQDGLNSAVLSRILPAMRKQREKKRRGCFGVGLRLALLVVLIAVIVVAFVFRGALYNRFYRFPKQAAAWDAIRAQRVQVNLDDGWPEFRGVMHNHSELSHDSLMSFPAIAAALREADVDFIFMSDHCEDGKADYSLGWRGEHEGIVFIRGYEMSYGFMPWGLPEDTVLECGEEEEALARQIHDLGGLLFFAHCEVNRSFDLPELHGVEIYNIHTDLMDESMADLWPDIVLSLRAYPDQTFRILFDRPTQLIEQWDRFNASRKMVGIAANDAHNNTGFRGFYTEADTLRVLSTGDDDVVGEWDLNVLTRSLLRLLPGPLETGEQIFRVDLDPYVQSARFVNTHLLAHECTEEALLDAVRAGRAFIGFDMIADARGFVFLAEAEGSSAVMGESLGFSPGLTLRSASPHTCRFTLVADGQTAAQATGTSFEFKPTGPGKYRIEADLEILGEWTPWVYTNPIHLAAAPASS